MNAEPYLKFLVEEIHSVIFATIDTQGHPLTCAIDLMDHDAHGLYFLTATGKSFYHRLKRDGHIALSGMKGKDTLSCVSISLQGQAREIGTARLPRLFALNPYMEKIYPTEASRRALTVFCIEQGRAANGSICPKARSSAHPSLSGTLLQKRAVISSVTRAPAVDDVRRYVRSNASMSSMTKQSSNKHIVCIAAIACRHVLSMPSLS